MGATIVTPCGYILSKILSSYIIKFLLLENHNIMNHAYYKVDSVFAIWY